MGVFSLTHPSIGYQYKRTPNRLYESFDKNMNMKKIFIWLIDIDAESG